MADADVQITAGSGTKIDTRTVGAGSDEHRQVVVIGDPTTAANVGKVNSNGSVATSAFLAASPTTGTDAISNSGAIVYPVAESLAAGLLGSVQFVFDGTNNGWDRMRSIEALSGTNVDTGVAASGIGPGYDRKNNPASISATSTSNAVTVVVNGSDSITFHVTAIGTTPGSMIFETTGDDFNWATAGAVIKLGSVETFVEGSFVPAVNDVYMVRTTGVRQVRYRVNAAYGSGSTSVKVTGSVGPAVVKAVEMPGAPHKIGYAITGATAQYAGSTTSTTLGPTVSSSQRMVVTSIQIQAGGTTAGTVQVYFGTGAYSRGTNLAIFDGEFAPSSTSKPGFAATPSVPYMGAADAELKVTSSAVNPLTVTIWYYLVAA